MRMSDRKNGLPVERLEQIISYPFHDKGLLEQALCHSSYANEQAGSAIEDNERLEFLGDAVLELTVSEYLYGREAKMPEGDMTKLRASIVCEPTLFLCAKKFDLGEYLRLGKGADLTGGRTRPSVVSDAMEALIGAIYLDGGFEAAKQFIDTFILKHIDHIRLFHDSKTILQEMLQSKESSPPSYELTGQEGPGHNRVFHVQVMWNGTCLGTGTGHSKKAAEQDAAYQAVLKLKECPPETSKEHR